MQQMAADTAIDDSSSSDEASDNEEQKSAVEKAAEIFQFVSVADKNCHCHCHLFDGQRCSEQFVPEETETIRMNMQEMLPYEKDLVLLGILSCSINATKNTLRTNRRNVSRKKNRIRFFFYEHKRICRDTFLYLMDISKGKLDNLKDWYIKHGMVPRKKRSGGRNKIALKLEDIQAVSRFILNFADQHSLILPGRVPGFKRSDVRILPSCETKASVWRLYKLSAEPGQRVVKLSTFRTLWRQLFPYVVVAKPMTDLCWVCQRNNTNIVRAVNVPEEDKSEVLKLQDCHLLTATKQRSHYTLQCQNAQEVAAAHNLKDFCKSTPNSLPATFHYSFDFAQQVHYPANPMQPGPIYFKVPRRCQIFGIHAEGIGKQVNYLIDESMHCGKGANVVISLLHHFLENFGVGEHHLELTADNCAGQNKNAYVMWYLCWRMARHLHQSASISFMLAGHTKFAPDWCFGLLKRTYRRTFVSSLHDIEQVVAASSLSGINKSVLVGNERGDVFVPMYDWVSYFKPHFRKVPGIKSNHHFFFSIDRPGVVTMKLFCDSPTTEQQLAVSDCPPHMPEELVPKGLDAKRMKYLFDEIRQFCREETKDIVCPSPSPLNLLRQDDVEAGTSSSSIIETKAIEEQLSDLPSNRVSGKKSKQARGQLLCDSDSDYEPIAVKRGRGSRGQRCKRGTRGRGRGRGK